MSNVLVFLVKMLNLLLKSASNHKDCPDGICAEPLALSASLETQLKSPNVSFGIFDLLSFLRCFPMDRVMAVAKRIAAVVKGCNRCPDGDCSFVDLLGCLDLKEVVSICMEVLAIIRDSQICKGDGGTEITLGQAAA